MTTPAVGIHHGVPPEEYHSWRALSHSWMNRLRISPAHLLDLMEHGWDEGTKAEAFGTAVHTLVLEPASFGLRYVIRLGDMKGTTKAGKALKADAESMGMTVLPEKEYRWVQAVAGRTMENPLVRDWLSHDHETEVSLVWERDGYLCKARVDLVVPGPCIMADLKTTITASEKGFAAQVARYNYHGQAAWYMDGMQRLTGRVWDFYFIACEKRRPFLVSVHQLARGTHAHNIAVAECDLMFNLYRLCCETRQWPGYGDKFEIQLPSWALEMEQVEDVEEPF